MGKSLVEIAEDLRERAKKVQLIYAFNGVGKTRLSRTFKEIIAPNHDDDKAEENQIVKFLLDHLVKNRYWKEEEQQ